MMLSSYKHFFNIISQYWRAYGGIKAMLCSPYFHLSVLFSYAAQSWYQDINWAQMALEIIPSLLGFSLGAFAIFLAFSDPLFVNFLTKRAGRKTSQTSAYLKISALFVHFMLIQVAAIFLALFSKLPPPNATACITHAYAASTALAVFFFLYSMLTVIAVAFSLLRLAALYSKFNSVTNEDKTSD